MNYKILSWRSSSFLLIEKNANFTPFLYIAVKALLFPLKHNFTSLHFKSVVLLSDKQGAPSRRDARKRRLKWPHHPDQERRRPLVTSHHRLSATQWGLKNPPQNGFLRAVWSGERVHAGDSSRWSPWRLRAEYLPSSRHFPDGKQKLPVVVLLSSLSSGRVKPGRVVFQIPTRY